MDGRIVAAVYNFFDKKGLDDSKLAYLKELKAMGIPLNKESIEVAEETGKEDLVSILLRSFEDGDDDGFFKIWDPKIAQATTNQENYPHRLEFQLHVYFAVYPLLRSQKGSDTGLQTRMRKFKEYLESGSSAVSKTTDSLQYYALPFVSNVREHPSFARLFDTAWAQDLRKECEDFLRSRRSSGPCYMEKVLSELDQLRSEVKSNLRKMAAFQLESTRTKQHLNALHQEHHAHISVTAELIELIENSILGTPISPEALRVVCAKLMAAKAGSHPSTPAQRPSAQIRASLSDRGTGSPNVEPDLDFDRIKLDLYSAGSNRRLYLLQALRRRLTKAASYDEAYSTLMIYISEDLVGCLQDEGDCISFRSLLQSEKLLAECAVRLLNAICCFPNGRKYVCQSDALIRAMSERIIQTPVDSRLGRQILSTVQKLSLKRKTQDILLDKGAVDWLFNMLKDVGRVSEYCLEYGSALLMNLCLRTEGRQRCKQRSADYLNVLVNLLQIHNPEIWSYTNGILYSLFTEPAIRKTALRLGLDVTLSGMIGTGDDGMDNQLHYVISRLGESPDVNDGENRTSITPNHDSEDSDGYAEDADIESDESLPSVDGLKGDSLLAEYSRLSVSTKPRNESRSRVLTPSRRNNTGLDRSSVDSQSSSDRREPKSDNPIKPVNTDSVFAAKPKIPRTPDVASSRSSSTSTPVPIHTVSPSVRRTSGESIPYNMQDN